MFLLACCVSLLSGCSMFGFLQDKPEIEPDELADFDEEVELRRIWSVNVGKGQGEKYNRLKPAILGTQIFAAASNGRVVAVDRETGRTNWQTRLDYDITGGVGVGGNLVLVGTEDSRVIAMNRETGEVIWEAVVSSEVLSAPATDGRFVVAQTVDGKLVGLNANNGEQIWLYENSVPALTLRGTSSPLIVDNFVLSASASGTVVSLALDNGTLRWEQRVAIPTGRSEIDRIVDIDGDLVINDGGLVLVPSYQGYLAAIDAVTGQTRWRVQESSSEGASFGFGNVYVVNAIDQVKAYRIGQDDLIWENDQLNYRRLSPPTSFNNYVAVGDFEGYVHLLSQINGEFVGRTRVGSNGIRGKMLSQGGTLYIYGNGGNLVAMRIQENR